MVEASSHTPKGCGPDSWSGHIPRLRVQSLVGVQMIGNQSVFSSHINVPLSLSKKKKSIKNILSDEDLKEKCLAGCPAYSSHTANVFRHHFSRQGSAGASPGAAAVFAASVSRSHPPVQHNFRAEHAEDHTARCWVAHTLLWCPITSTCYLPR